MRRPSLVLVTLLCLAALPLAALPLAALPLADGAAATDLRIQLNPVLAELHERDPDKAAAVINELTRIIDGEAPSRPGTRGIENAEERALIRGNPLFEEAWRIDPKAALEQLREIVASGGCTVPVFAGTTSPQAWKDEQWARYVTVAPRPRTPSEQRYSDRRLRSRN